MSLLFEYIKKYKGSFILSFTLISISVASQLIQPNIMSNIINAIVSQDTSMISTYGILMIGLAVLGFVVGIANTAIAAKVSQKVGYDLRERVFNKVQGFSFSNVESYSASNLVIRTVNDAQQAQSLIMIMLQQLSRIPILFTGSFVLAIIKVPQLWWVPIMVLVLVLIVMMGSFGMMGPKFGRIQRGVEKINNIAKENFSGMRVVKSFVQEESETNKFTEGSLGLTQDTIFVGIVFSFLMPTFYLIMDGTIAFVVYIMGDMAKMDPAIIGNAVSFISYLVMIMMSLLIGGMMMSFASRAFVSVGRIKEVLDTVNDMEYVSDSREVQSGSIKFSNVSYTYASDEEESVTDVSFEIEHGKTLGVIGATGSGKSTLAQLIARIYDPSSGEILIDELNIKSYEDSKFRSNVAIVLQRPVLFSGTIADNIRQGKQNASEDELIRAAKISQSYEFISKLEKGFNSEVYQRGTNFSGGQKQRISIARGVVSNPKVLILDDSTSALDAKSERKVQEALMEDMNDTTKVIVSQKISSIIHADTILVLDKGRLVAQGTHSELINSSEVYREIYATQMGNPKLVEEDV